MTKLLFKLQRKYGRYAISNPMLYIVIAQAFLFLASSVMPMLGLTNFLILDIDKVMHWQIWRLVTFILVPEGNGILFILTLYFYYIMGNGLEQIWGTFHLNVYYIIGMLGAVIAAFLSYFLFGSAYGFGFNYYVNMSLFFAFGILNPDFEMRMFFFLPIKMKWLVLFDAAVFIYQIVVAIIAKNWSVPITILFSLINVLLFFGEPLISRLKKLSVQLEKQKRYRQAAREWKKSQQKVKRGHIRVEDFRDKNNHDG